MRETKEVKLCQPPKHLKVRLIARSIFPVKGNCLYKARCKAINIGSSQFAYVLPILFHFSVSQFFWGLAAANRISSGWISDERALRNSTVFTAVSSQMHRDQSCIG